MIHDEDCKILPYKLFELLASSGYLAVLTRTCIAQGTGWRSSDPCFVLFFSVYSFQIRLWIQCVLKIVFN